MTKAQPYFLHSNLWVKGDIGFDTQVIRINFGYIDLIYTPTGFIHKFGAHRLDKQVWHTGFTFCPLG